jgi:hypothetical protein
LLFCFLLCSLRSPLETTHATQLRRLNQHRHHRQRLRRRHHQHLHPDVQTSLVIGRVRLEAHAPITYQSLIVLLMVAMVAVGTKAQMVPSMIGQSMEWQPMLLVVVVVAVPQ